MTGAATDEVVPRRRRQRTSREVIPFLAGDGRPLSLVHVRGETEPHRGPVLLVHGAGVRAEIFMPPTGQTIVDALLDDGWDPWLLNWRASIDLEPVPWTLDQAAAHDHPAAVREVLRRTGADTLRAIIHCQGSTSFMMASVAGLLPEVDVILSNAVSLHPVVPPRTRMKIRSLVPVLEVTVPALSPAWGDRRSGPISRVITASVRATHRECSNSVCRMVSFTYGTGPSTLWSHDNLDDATHDWIRGEFADVPITFFSQMSASVARGQMVRSPRDDGLASLPEAYAAEPPRTSARFALFAGEDNRCFLPESQVRTHAHLRRTRADSADTLHILPGYGHLDMFLGKRAAVDVFPLMLSELAG